MSANLTCNYCAKPFKYEHIHFRHEKFQCRMKKKKMVEPNPVKQIEQAEFLVKQYLEELKSASPENISLVQRNLDEAITLNKLTITLKNSKPYYCFKCVHCDEGFEFEREKINHQLSCFWKENDIIHKHNIMEGKPKKQEVVLKTKKDTKITSTTKEEPKHTSVENELRAELELQQREIKHLQDKIKELREQVEIVNKVRTQLEELHDIKFQLSLFKVAALRGSIS